MKQLACIVLATLTAICVASCHHGPTEQEKQVMSQLTASMETQCIGRYLVDLPKDFRWMNPDLTLYYGRDEDFHTIEVQVPNYHAKEVLFKDSVKKREIELAAVVNSQTGKSNLLDSEQEAHGGTMFTSYKNSGAALARSHELHLLVGHAHVIVKASSYEGVSDSKEDLSPAVKASMLKLAEHIRPVTDPEKVGRGFCLGAVVVDSDNDFENADMTFEMAGHTDVTVGIWMDNQSNAPDTLRDRMSAFGSAADGKHLTILRSGDLILAGIPAQEVLVRIVDGGRTEFHFVIESRPKRPSLLEEGINMRLTTGGQLSDGRYVDSSLTQNEALALWDDMVKSFKPRPGAVRASSAHK